MGKPREITADLHLHSFYSDGQVAPAEVARRAAAAGLTAFSLTDHDSLEGVAEARRQAEVLGLVFVPGVELSTQCLGQDVHLLAYGVENRGPLAEHLQTFRRARQERFHQMVRLLKEQGLDIEEEGEQLLARCSAPGRLHAALILEQKRLLSDVKEAFTRYLHEGGPAYVPKAPFPLEQAINTVWSCGGLPVLAHPGIYRRQAAVIEQALAAGVAGLEVYHSKHRPDQERGFLENARTAKILVLGGSDSHFCQGEDIGEVGGRGLGQRDWERFRAALAERPNRRKG